MKNSIMIRMFRMFLAIRTLHKIIGHEPFDLIRAQLELFANTWLFTSFKLIRDRGKLEYYEHRKNGVSDLLVNAERLGFIEPIITNSWKKRYQISTKGRNFLNIFYFIEYSAREFGYMASVVSAFGVGAVLAMITYIITV